MAMPAEESTSEVSLIYMIGRLDHGIRRDMRRVLARWGLSVPEFTALSILRRRPGLSNAQMARRTMVTPQSMIEILARLESRDLVVRKGDPNHGRILRSQLTPEGARLVAAAQAAMDSLQDDLLSGLEQDQRELLLAAMRGAMQRLQDARRAAT
jgi:DNA-binding MarR family transcriptional regulator